MNKLLAALFSFLCTFSYLPAKAGQAITVFLEWNAFGLGHSEAGSHPGPKIDEERLGTLAVKFTPNKGVSAHKAWNLVRDAVKDDFYGSLTNNACSRSLIDAQWQREMAIRSIEEKKVPVHNITVIYSCN